MIGKAKLWNPHVWRTPKLRNGNLKKPKIRIPMLGKAKI